MAYVIVTLHGKELQRRKLDGPVTIGRSLEPDIVLEDTGVSRKHCQLEPEGDDWVVVDLQSRNGTRVNNRTIDRHVLKQGDIIALGHTKISFHTGKFVGPRPADPSEALLSETVVMSARREPPTRPLPTPKIGRVDTKVLDAPEAEQTPLPFTRPPARPIVKEDQ